MRQYDANRAAEKREYARQWRADNPEKCKEQDAEKARRREENGRSEREKCLARIAQRRYRDSHPEVVAAQRERSNIRRRERYKTDEGFREQAKARSRATMPARQVEYRAKLKAEVFAHYGAKCACCGETEPFFLTLGHVNGDGAAHRRKMNGGSGRSGGASARIWLDIVRRGFPPDFRIECYNCNCGSWRNGGVCPHVRGKLMKETRNTDVQQSLLPVASPEVLTTASGRVSPEQP